MRQVICGVCIVTSAIASTAGAQGVTGEGEHDGVGVIALAGCDNPLFTTR